MGNTKQNQGFVLVAVLWMLVILTVLTMGFSHRVMLERRGARYGLDKEQAQSMARGAVYRAMLELENKPVFDQLAKEVGVTSRRQRWARPIDMFNEANYFLEPADMGMETDSCWVEIEDCESRFSLNDAPIDLLEGIKALKSRNIKDVETRRKSSNGFASHPFMHKDEFAANQGISDGVWYGSDRDKPLRENFTVWGGAAGKININTASEEVLSLLPDLNRDALDALIAFRNGDDELFGTRDDRVVRDLNTLAGVLDISAEKVGPLKRYCKIDSQFFVIRTKATLRDSKIRAYCEVVVKITTGGVLIQDWSEEINAA